MTKKSVNIDLGGSADVLDADDVIDTTDTVDLDVNDDEIVTETPVSIDTDDDDIVNEDLDPADRLPDNAVMNDDGSVTLTLRFPQVIKSKRNGKVREKTYKELLFHRLNGKDLRVVQSASEEQRVSVSMARSTRINQAVMNALFDKMVDYDINGAGQVLNHFFASGRTTSTRG